MRYWLRNTGRGLLMGLSDSIPGVSGGTIALILGIYPRLIEALGTLGAGTLGRLLNKQTWRRAGEGLRAPDELGYGDEDVAIGHLLFLGSLGVGVVAAIITGARYIPTLLDLYPAQMRGLFLGLVLASVAIPIRMMKQRDGVMWALILVSAGLTLWFVGLPEKTGGNARGTVTLEFAEPPAEALRVGPQNLTLSAPGVNESSDVAFGPARTIEVPAGAREFQVEVVARMAGEAANLPAGSIRELRGLQGSDVTVRNDGPMTGGENPHLLLIFVAGIVAISAMILPGISGSFVLLLFGLYHYVTHSLDAALFDRDPQALAVVVTMVSAIAIGLLTFSRVLRWLFARAPDRTLAVLVGLMLGSLRKLWPFTELSDGGREVLRLPAGLDTGTIWVIGAFAAGLGTVFFLESLGRRARTDSS